MRQNFWTVSRTLVVMGTLLGTSARAADAPSAKLALSFQPVHKNDVDFETPTGEELDKCQVKVERRGKVSGWVVYGSQGQVLRRFVDTNSDNVVDQWQYYNQGVEVYRDLDLNNNNKVDQSRWLNTAGTRWALDANEDGRIDSWKMISAEETSRLAVQAMIANDVRTLETLLIDQHDIETLGIQEDLAKKLLEAVSSPSTKVKEILDDSQILTAGTKWMRFDGASPGVIPQDDGKADADLIVYENAMGIVEANQKAGLVQIGEMVRVGDVWKLTQIPRPLEGDAPQLAAGGLLIQPNAGMISPGTEIPGDVSPEARKLLEQLQKLDADAPTPAAGPKVLADYNRQRADLLKQLAGIARNDKEREQWTRQLIDGLTAAVQTGQFPDGLNSLKEIETTERRKRGNDEMVAYVSYRVLMSQYAISLQKPQLTNEQRQELQTWWLDQLETFAKTYPKAPETAEALFQLAMAQEFAGKIEEATGWYNQLVKTHAGTEAGVRASGALRRLNLDGKTLELSGPGLSGGPIDVAKDYRGRVLLVIFWSTWCKPCTEDLPQIKALYDQYRRLGFEVLGVNLDNTTDPVQPYLTEHKVPWPHVHEPGGLESEPGKAFGIISLPTMFLVDKDGTVISRSTSVQELKVELPKRLK